MMTPESEAQLLALLRSSRPSERGAAARWLLTNATPSQEQDLILAIEKETVPALRRQLALARDAITASHAARRTDDVRSLESDDASILDGLSALLRHETEPIIGWLRRAAAEEIGPGYETSQTFANIELLRHRIRGLETLTAAHRRIHSSTASLGSLIRACQPTAFSGKFVETSSDDSIVTDEGLFTLVIGNALLNATEAAQATKDGNVLVETGITLDHFWISITNHFEGAGFTLDQVVRSGTSSKERHKGLGLGAMQLAAERLGYEVALRADGGTAHFTLRGPRTIA